MCSDSNRVCAPVSAAQHARLLLLRLADLRVGSGQGLLLSTTHVELGVDESLHQLLISLLLITCLVQIASAFAIVVASLSRINSDTALLDVGREIAICSIHNILRLL